MIVPILVQKFSGVMLPGVMLLFPGVMEQLPGVVLVLP
jgi:hypothetical protein